MIPRQRDTKRNYSAKLLPLVGWCLFQRIQYVLHCIMKKLTIIIICLHSFLLTQPSWYGSVLSASAHDNNEHHSSPSISHHRHDHSHRDGDCGTIMKNRTEEEWEADEKRTKEIFGKPLRYLFFLSLIVETSMQKH